MLTIVTALPWEADRFVRRLTDRRRVEMGEGWAVDGSHATGAVRVIVTGPGGERVRATAAALRSLESAATEIVATGVAGGLSDEIGTGQVVIASEFSVAAIAADEFLRRQGPRLQPDSTLTAIVQAAASESGLTHHTGVSVTVDRELLGSAAKRREHQRSQAIVVQMEDYTWAEVSAELGVPFASGRVVLDPVNTSVPEAVLGWDWRGPRRAEIARGIARRPWLPLRLVPLAWRRERARRSIDRLLASLVQLAGAETEGERAS